MRRLIVVVVLASLAAGGTYCYWNYDIDIHSGQDGLEAITIRPKEGGSTYGQASVGPLRPVIRIATFNLGRLDEKKLNDPHVAAILAHVIPRFDVVAVQEIRAGDLGMLARLVEKINAGGARFDFATAPITGPDAGGQQSAFLLNRAMIEIDRSTVQLVEDPQRRFRHRPLVALFRVRGPDPTEAFTFKLINVHTEPDRAAVELELLDDVYRAVRDDQSDEDDVILLGDLGVYDGAAGRLDQLLEITSSVTTTPTTISGTGPVDNIMFDTRATTEFTGQAGVLDLIGELNLTWREVSEVSEHLPVWAEFSSFEVGGPGYMAGHAGRTTR